MGEVFSTYRRQERCVQDFGGEILSKRVHLVNIDVDWRITLKWIFKKWD
jgi:hypothetical protein